MSRLWKTIAVIAVVIIAAVAFLVSRPDLILQFAAGAERSKSGLELKQVMADGFEWPYLDSGVNPDDKDQPVILMLHGFGADKDNWTRFAGFFTGKKELEGVEDETTYRVIAPDLPGFGENERDQSKTYDMQNQRERLNKFVEALGLSKFHLVGNSMGGNLTAAYTEKWPEKVITVGLFDSAGVAEPEPSDMSKAVARGENPLLVNSVEDFDRLLNFVFVVPPEIPGPVKTYLAEQSVKNRAFNEKIFKEYRANMFRLEPVLPNINQPSLVLWGDTDRLIHVSSARLMHDLLPNSRLLIMDKMGHSPMIERPQETANHYKRFLLDAADGKL